MKVLNQIILFVIGSAVGEGPVGEKVMPFPTTDPETDPGRVLNKIFDQNLNFLPNISKMQSFD